jgi:hypothetical protein
LATEFPWLARRLNQSPASRSGFPGNNCHHITGRRHLFAARPITACRASDQITLAISAPREGGKNCFSEMRPDASAATGRLEVARGVCYAQANRQAGRWACVGVAGQG